MGESRNYRLVSTTGSETLVEVHRFENRSLASTTPIPPTNAVRNWLPDPTAADSPDDEPMDDLFGSILVLRDITARRQMEDRLVQSQRMEAVANMAGGLAHDFNNQLTVILGYADELYGKSEGEVRAGALVIKQAASIAASITRQLLTLSRRSAVHFEVLNIDEVIYEVRPIISHCLGKTRTVVTDLASPDGLICADRNQMKQVLVNLAVNARDAMPKGGVLQIGSSTIEIEPGSQDARLYRPGRYVRLRVGDTGEGMDKATLARIFEPFFTTKKPGFGTGLGLAITHSVIVQSAGYVAAASEPGLGTSFEILLPCVGASKRKSAVTGSELAHRRQFRSHCPAGRR